MGPSTFFFGKILGTASTADPIKSQCSLDMNPALSAPPFCTDI
jgi:hypothetical protein